ncbi:hypothetical protein EQG49_05090 [Periweissella cryptocerci]|uniref:Uncharacterized protein n=1 Tax=Periweissella cryptocerci TaxID=2506420 RepID=A0A4P6YT75_9LACO|nr:hypothetical protein [Periweissella cryptocerci]QBO35876.1 hypothetical protein EQG49_05090 [Periweissella cryptocerci]
MKQHVRNYSKLDEAEAKSIATAFLGFANGAPVDEIDDDLQEQIDQLATELKRGKTLSYVIGRLGDYQKAYTKAFNDQSQDKEAQAFYNGVQTGMNFLAGVGMVLDGRIDQAGLAAFLEETEKEDTTNEG